MPGTLPFGAGYFGQQFGQQGGSPRPPFGPITQLHAGAIVGARYGDFSGRHPTVPLEMIASIFVVPRFAGYLFSSTRVSGRLMLVQ